MTNLFGILLVALLGFASIFTVVSQDCPGLFLKAKVRPSARRGILAGKGHAKIAVTLTSKEPVDNLEFQLNLPKGLSVGQTAMRPSRKPYISPKGVENTDGTTVIYWLNIALTKRKGGKRRFRVKVKADECAPEMLEVDAFAYAVNGTGASCITPLAHSQIVKVRYSKSKKAATCAPTPAPTINPAQPFVLFGEGQQFSQGARQAPFQDRRLSVPSPIDMHKDIAALSPPKDRQLQSIDTPGACYEYCSLNAGEETPFFFSWNTVTNQCFCCVTVCTPFIFDPDSSVYEVTAAKTLQPTMAPTAPPTAAPTLAPTMQPTAAPTLAPTMQPTAAPTLTPTMQPTAAPTLAPTMQPTAAPTLAPTMAPTMQLTAAPTVAPTMQPTPDRVGSLTFSLGENQLRTSFQSEGYAYFGTNTDPGIVVKVDLTNFTQVNSLTLDPDEGALYTSAVYGDYAYFGAEASPGIVVKVSLENFTRVDSLTFDSGENRPFTSVLSGSYAYFGTLTSPGIVVKVNLTDFTRVEGLILSTGTNNLRTSVIKDDFAYFGALTDPAIVAKINLTDFSQAGSLILNSGENGLVSSLVSGDYAYFGTNNSPGKVVKVNLTDFTRVGSLTLNQGEDQLVTSVLRAPYAYFGTNTSPGIVVKVNLSDLSLVRSLTLDSGEDKLFTSVASHSYAYFGTLTTPGQVVKVTI